MDVPVLEQARIQARVLVPIVKALEDELGAERAHALSGRCWAISTVAMARSSGGRRSRPALDRGWHLRSAPSRAATLSTIDVNRRRYAEFYRELGEPELGFLLVCSADFLFSEGFGADIELTRTQTPMQGASHCDFRYRRKTAD